MAEANSKKTAISKEEIETKDIQENVNDKIDINLLISQSVEKAVQKTAEQYGSIISELQTKINTLSDENKDLKNTSSKTDSAKRVKLMHMGAGRANFSRGKVNVEFTELFDTRTVRYEIFEDMMDMFPDTFRSFETVIVDKNIREQVGLEMNFKQHGADKETFYEMLKMNISDCTLKISSFNYVVSMAFLKFFVTEYMTGNIDASNNFMAITKFYQDHFGLDQIQEQIQEMRSLT